MYKTPPQAEQLFADLTHDAPIPVCPREFTRRRPRYQSHGDVLIGDIHIPRYKHRGRWRYLEKDVRRAARQLPRDLDDVVAVDLPDAEWTPKADWRAQLGRWLADLARRVYPGQDPAPWTDARPGALEFPGVQVDVFSIGGTLPLRLVGRVQGQWVLPRAYAELLDRWQARENELAEQVRICRDCGTRGPADGSWRTVEDTGYVTRCPPCSRALVPRYEGQLAGRTYQWARESRHRAAEYLCRLCGAQRAYAWDHCHIEEHQFVRGPLCGSCNTSEGKKTFEALFLQRQGAVGYLLGCLGCRAERSLPEQYRPAVVQAHLERTERHGRCAEQPAVTPAGAVDGAYRFVLRCRQHPREPAWTRSVTAGEAQALVRGVVDSALSGTAAAAEDARCPGPTKARAGRRRTSGSASRHRPAAGHTA
jgi:hypothetical protein